MKIQSILNQGLNILEKNKIPNPRLDVEILLSSSIKKDKKYIILNSQEFLSLEQLDEFMSLVERRKKGEPIAYILKKKNFGKMNFM